jgi:ectoine hydroxylase-related dioxygenase (phytanoyl-CoA dioxygenase family)
MIANLPTGSTATGVVETLARDGVAVVDRLVDEATVDAVLAELGTDLDASEAGGGEFFGGRAKRLSGILNRSVTAADIVGHPLLLEVMEEMLSPLSLTQQLQTAAVLQVWEGGAPQQLHRDEGVYYPFLPRLPGRPEHMMTVMVALSDFTADNGATRVIPGSHAWPADREGREEETVQAVMPRGSVAVWSGSTLHGMAVNRTATPRTGLVFGYSLGWLRQEENHYLTVPADVARRLPERVQQLLGYEQHGPLLGWAQGRDPANQLRAAQAW